MDRTPYSKYNFRFDRLDEQLTFSEIALRHGITSVRGGCFYEVVRPETVSATKRVFLVRKSDKKAIEGTAARAAVGLPVKGGRVRPSDVPEGHMLFVESTSWNRKTVPSQQIIFLDMCDPHKVPVPQPWVKAELTAAPSTVATTAAAPPPSARPKVSKSLAASYKYHLFRVETAPSASTVRVLASKFGIFGVTSGAFYELVRKEKVSYRKRLYLVRESDGMALSDAQVQEAMGLGTAAEAIVVPSQVPDGHILFVLSTSSNRKLLPGQRVLFDGVAPAAAGATASAPASPVPVVPPSPKVKSEAAASSRPLLPAASPRASPDELDLHLEAAGSVTTMAKLRARSGAAAEGRTPLFELVKKENVSGDKRLVLLRASDGAVFADAKARILLRLGGGDAAAKVAPTDVPEGLALFVESKSLSRKLARGQRAMWL